MDWDDLKQLIVNTQRKRFERAAEHFSKNPDMEVAKLRLLKAVEALAFANNMDNDAVADSDFWNIPIGKVNDKIDELVSSYKEE